MSNNLSDVFGSDVFGCEEKASTYICISRYIKNGQYRYVLLDGPDGLKYVNSRKLDEFGPIDISERELTDKYIKDTVNIIDVNRKKAVININNLSTGLIDEYVRVKLYTNEHKRLLNIKELTPYEFTKELIDAIYDFSGWQLAFEFEEWEHPIYWLGSWNEYEYITDSTLLIDAKKAMEYINYIFETKFDQKIKSVIHGLIYYYGMNSVNDAIHYVYGDISEEDGKALFEQVYKTIYKAFLQLDIQKFLKTLITILRAQVNIGKNIYFKKEQGNLDGIPAYDYNMSKLKELDPEITYGIENLDKEDILKLGKLIGYIGDKQSNQYVVTCIQKFRDKNNTIIGYRLKDYNGSIKDVNSKQLKQALMQNKISIDNLQLTSDNRIVDKK